LQFKKRVMYLINITKSAEYLEDKFVGKGVNHPAAIAKTDFGIVWANEDGCYLYNGQSVQNLTELKISFSIWAAHMDANSLVGYHPASRKIIVTGGGTNNINAYVFDIATKSWAYMLSVFDNVPMSNFVINSTGDLLFATEQSNGLQKWTETATAGTISLKTKDYDFGQPGQRKKIYKAYVSYKGDGTGINLQYSVNGDTDTTAPFYRTSTPNSDGLSKSDGTNSDTTPLLSVGTDDWVTAELKPVSSISNVYSFQLIFAGTSVADFEINDMSVVYRLKPVR
jgi:hypothetical protein